MNALAPPDADIAYERDKRLAADPTVEARCGVARSPTARPEILYYLASDGEAAVRREVAANPNTPLQAALLLVRDRDDTVRAALALRLAATARSLVPDSPTPIDPRFFELLDILARDAAAQVRRTLAEAIKDAPHAPAALIEALARDPDMAIAGPVLRHSPVLTQERLLALIANPSSAGMRAAIAQRPHLDADSCARLAGAGDDAAIAALLANASASIDEAALALIAEQAPAHPSWHPDLIRRPSLPAQIIRRIAAFISTALLRQLGQRQDLDGETRALIAAEIERRPPEAPRAAAGAQPAAETAAERVLRLKGQGALDEAAVAGALEQGDRGFVKAALAAMSGLPESIVDKAFRAQSAKGIVALTWKAGLSPRLATQIQLRLGGFPPKQAIGARDGAWPLTPEEMTWYLEFLGA